MAENISKYKTSFNQSGSHVESTSDLGLFKHAY